jgi:hypothetical protein
MTVPKVWEVYPREKLKSIGKDIFYYAPCGEGFVACGFSKAGDEIACPPLRPHLLIRLH